MPSVMAEPLFLLALGGNRLQLQKLKRDFRIFCGYCSYCWGIDTGTLGQGLDHTESSSKPILFTSDFLGLLGVINLSEVIL